MSPLTSRYDPPQSSLPRLLTWAAVIMVLLALPLMANFVGRMQAEARMRDEVQRRTEQVRQAELLQTQLNQALEYAKSEAFTERYAREEAHYAKAGEVVVIPPDAQNPTRPLKLWWEDFVDPQAVK